MAALTFRDLFRAGASLYGVADLAALARETHKFESRYLDGLVGPWPEAEAIYERRSPIHHTDGLSCPIILLQGLEDEIVPPGQAELMVEALQRKGLPHAYLAFEGEQHGFRRASSIVRALEAELYFYSRVFGFDLADPVEPVDIAFDERLWRRAGPWGTATGRVTVRLRGRCRPRRSRRGWRWTASSRRRRPSGWRAGWWPRGWRRWRRTGRSGCTGPRSTTPSCWPGCSVRSTRAGAGWRRRRPRCGTAPCGVSCWPVLVLALIIVPTVVVALAAFDG